MNLQSPKLQVAITSAGMRSPSGSAGEVKAAGDWPCKNSCSGNSNGCDCCYWYWGWLCSSQRRSNGSNCCKWDRRGRCTKYCANNCEYPAHTQLVLTFRRTSYSVVLMGAGGSWLAILSPVFPLIALMQTGCALAKSTNVSYPTTPLHRQPISNQATYQKI